MECNRDEALRSLNIAQRKFGAHDYAGCKKFVAKAQQLFPALEGAAQILAAVEVLIIAQRQAHGKEHDWYGMLQVDPHADDATIRKQYRKLALTLHPDKNKFAGAEAAFKLVGEAWGVLSDPGKRLKYNERRGIKVYRNFNPSPNPSFGQMQGFCGSGYVNHHASSSAAPRSSATATFWTACPFCNMQYQYFTTYENFHLLCQKCKRGYVARDTNKSAYAFEWSNVFGEFSSPFGPGLFSKFAPSRPNVGGNSSANGFVNGSAFDQMGASTTAAARDGTSVPGATATATSAVAAELVRQMYQKAKKEREDAQREERRREREKERLDREREKEERRKEREAQKKLREEQKRREAMEKLSLRQKEIEEREAARRRKAERSKTKSKKYESDEEESDEDELLDGFEDCEELEQMLSKDQGTARAEDTSKVEARRSSRMRRNISYKDGGSDDDENSTSMKKSKSESWRLLGCQSQTLDNGFNQNIEESSTFSGEMVGDANESCKMELGGKFRAYLREYVVPSLNCSKSMAKARVRSQKKANSPKNEIHKPALDKSRLFMVEEERLQAKVKDLEHLVQTQTHMLVEQKHVSSADKEQVGCEILPSIPVKESNDEASLTDMTVPDPDFHSFDGDRTVTVVRSGQIWAVYDDQDGMPRFYCRIMCILSTDPFKVRIQWLDANESSESYTQWIHSGHLLTSGEFKNSFSFEIYEQINVFSHVMIADVNQDGAFKIYPKKGEVWALYQGWTRKWLHKTKDNNEHKYSYDMVEVVSDFCEKTGINAIPLLKVHGFKTLFEHQVVRSPEDILHYPANEIFRFSHRVPAHRKSGLEAPNVPEGCWELDPASTPLELIHGQQFQDMQRSEDSYCREYQG